ncbi:hypothetical protein D9611_014340 [Ephemerocybe angulata]|uniref:CCHC-type domain-containing protein n=1 Tax=Ephemerocybe angulata TaxID=980116 RepID=A0A8H5B9E2_9AGAR|nr:hypothetical protein D9611_014340 [Tulosesus angulatus]
MGHIRILLIHSHGPPPLNALQQQQQHSNYTFEPQAQWNEYQGNAQQYQQNAQAQGFQQHPQTFNANRWYQRPNMCRPYVAPAVHWNTRQMPQQQFQPAFINNPTPVTGQVESPMEHENTNATQQTTEQQPPVLISAEDLESMLRRIAVLEAPAPPPPQRPRSDPQAVAYNSLLQRLAAAEGANEVLRNQLNDRPRQRSRSRERGREALDVKMKPQEPDTYDGTPERLETWLNQLALVWASSPSKFQDTRVRILYTFSKMRGGNAEAWVNVKQPMYLAREIGWDSWDAFIDELRKTFPSENRRIRAIHEVKTMRMDGRKPVQDFFIQWDRWAPFTGMNDAGLLVFLLEAVTSGLRHNMSNRYNLIALDTCEKFKEAAIETDNNWRFNQQLTGQTTGISNPPKLRAFKPFEKKSPNDVPKPVTSPATNPPSATKTTAPLPAEAEALSKKACFNCGALDHKVASCPRPKKPKHIIRNMVLEGHHSEPTTSADILSTPCEPNPSPADTSNSLPVADDLPPTKHPTVTCEEVPDPSLLKPHPFLPADCPVLLCLADDLPNLKPTTFTPTESHIINNLSHPEIAATQEPDPIPELISIEDDDAPETPSLEEYPQSLREITAEVLTALREKPIQPALELLSDLHLPRHTIAHVTKSPEDGSTTVPKALSQLLLHASFQTTNNDIAFDADALLDSGASECYIDAAYAESIGLSTVPLAHPVPAYNADGTENVAGLISATATMFMRIGAHTERIKLFLSTGGREKYSSSDAPAPAVTPFPGSKTTSHELQIRNTPSTTAIQCNA